MTRTASLPQISDRLAAAFQSRRALSATHRKEWKRFLEKLRDHRERKSIHGI